MNAVNLQYLQYSCSLFLLIQIMNIICKYFPKKCLYAMNINTLNTSLYDISLDDSIDQSNN